ncbi:hypothetical protein KL933_005296 [Ogataea haglerorum]|uniref:Putative tRNA (cytidine(32)/guanosine(34)-2'-O)-methyltransferase n=1 Tax=Ogataea haglerorum TaxID=1937702 RepID=A0AAN6D1F5_9ASCO|nr:uncharacterized protein KL911_004703 [Ogataea haglerorum]KAG7691390.1 hypothetical protein KL915_005286 [Ogataea haglerorum]KAG7691833.1 hypothetical protein KL951_005281 [Ogataea haglerorum]KAG7702228.1 hypothetical protein KL914_005359 [Ogataea haglerorum]KAG7702254.1 hypothetical protein KL950_005304 [Ogataea haglerorum]KAG7713038.1 hypothetical protein KL949_005332 [Ogataea haglerorum]
MGKSSKDKRDVYYRKAKEEGWRARSAYKLLQLNEQFGLFNDIHRVVDLCAAPGSWSQVLSREIFKDERSDAQIVAVDLQPMAPIDNVVTLQADITDPRTLDKILGIFGGEKADFVCSDGAPDVTGLHDLDEYIQAQLVLCALRLATCLLKEGGTFVAKIFRGRDIDLLYSQLGFLFEKVVCAKPRASRGTSLESFIVCIGYKPREGWKPDLQPELSTEEYFQNMNIGRARLHEDLRVDYEERKVAPFVACGDLKTSYDSDASYSLDTAVKHSLDPVQMPTDPPYKRALEMKRQGRLRGK